MERTENDNSMPFLFEDIKTTAALFLHLEQSIIFTP